MDGTSIQLQNDLDRLFSSRDSPRGEPDALTAHVRFWEGAKLNRPSPSFMLRLQERARSTRPKSANGSNLIVAVARGLCDGQRSSLRQSTNPGTIVDPKIHSRKQSGAYEWQAPGVLDYLDWNDLIHPVDHTIVASQSSSRTIRKNCICVR
jgi:hypothetical protein